MMALPIVAGILASMLHVLSGPDHMAAVTPLVMESSRKVWRIGLFWGLGHVTGMLLIGVLYLLLKNLIPEGFVEEFSGHSEQMVGIVLLVLGIWVFYRIFQEPKNHKHPHIHHEEESYIHIHTHHHDHNQPAHDHTHKKKIKQNLLSSFSIGVLHGFAGISHLLLLLPVLGFTTRSDSIQYLTGFGLGTILAMCAFALVLGRITNYLRKGHNWIFFKGIRLAGGLFAIIIGMYWLLF